jgi:hypothetical protein
LKPIAAKSNAIMNIGRAIHNENSGIEGDGVIEALGESVEVDVVVGEGVGFNNAVEKLIGNISG